MKFMNFLLLLVPVYGTFRFINGEQLKCEFKKVNYWNLGYIYSCDVRTLENTFNRKTISGYTGVHDLNKTDTDIIGIYIHDTNTKYIPSNLGLLFNLTVFAVETEQLVEIKSQDFLGMQDLRNLYLDGNKLISVPIDAFSTLPKLKLISLAHNQIESISNGIFNNNLNLEVINLGGNKIKFLSSYVFDGLTKLHYVELRDNICIKMYYSGSTEIIQLKNDIKMNCTKLNENQTWTTEKENTIVEKEVLELFNEIMKKITYLERLGNETLMKSEMNQEQEAIELKQQVKELNSKLSVVVNDQRKQQLRFKVMNETNNKLMQESYALNKELLEAKEIRQSERMVIIETKKELSKLKEERQKDKSEMERVKAELLKAYEKLSNCPKDELIDL